MPMPPIIALAGPIGVGKSTVAEALSRHGYVRESFAAPLKEMLAGFYRCAGASKEHIRWALYGAGKEVPDPLLCGKTPRYAMETLGTEWGRGLMDVRLWVNRVDAQISAHLARGQRFVIDDMRFTKELIFVRSYGGLGVELSREGVDYVGHHASRARLEGLPLIYNDGTPEQTAQAIVGREWSL